MKIGAAFGKLLTGEQIIREFLTVGIEDYHLVREKVYLRVGDAVLEVSGNQWLLSLDPPVIGIWVEDRAAAALFGPDREYRLYFRDCAPAPGALPGRNALSVLSVEFADRLDEKDGTLFLLRVSSTTIRHVSAIRARLIFEKFYKKPGLRFERLKTIAAAYTYPRRVRIISFQLEENYNYIFPMDLLADIRSCGRFLFGMRHSNQVLKRIVDVKKIVVAEAPASCKGTIYKLGRNHSASPPSLEEYPFGLIRTREFGYYLPEWVEGYKEVIIDRTADLGSHMLLSGQWSEEVVLKPAAPHLHHIHFLHFLYLKGRGTTYPVIQ
ncbi:MAG TPA: hypothetical protein VHE54_13555 [Puia sp.]|nr:hypothetical protein [Puia sp.]